MGHENPPWQRTTPGGGDVPFVDVSVDRASLAAALGAPNTADGLANTIARRIEGYAADPAAAHRWLRGDERVDLEDLRMGFTESVEAAGGRFGFTRGFEPGRGAVRRSYGPTVAWLVLLSRVFRTAALDGLESDSTIRWHLYNEALIGYLAQLDTCAHDLVDILDARGLDFFLPLVGTPEWDESWSTCALFDQVRLVSDCLVRAGRSEQAAAVREDLGRRQRAFEEIGEWLPSRGEGGARVAAESAWVSYLGTRVWGALSDESRDDLVQSGLAAHAVENGLYRSWRYPLQSLLLVVERELNLSLFAALRGGLAGDSAPRFDGAGRGARARRRTFDAVIRAHQEERWLTLGDIAFVLTFWNDPRMDGFTTLFTEARELAERFVPGHAVVMDRVRQTLGAPVMRDEPQWDIVKLRNACAHPGNEARLEDRTGHDSLYAWLGAPPQELLSAVVLGLRRSDA